MLLSYERDCLDELGWARRALSGTELIDENRGSAAALLSLIPALDRVLGSYLPASASWASVTPVILPGFDDRSKSKAESMIRKAIRQAGYSEALAAHADLDWRSVGFWKGAELASRYRVPDYLRNYPRYHVRLTWRDWSGTSIPVSGPICFGAGRFCGFGLFAAVDD
jgi:CRISPR-associated protein Csb2